jgi:hypothetical protein
MIRKLYGFSDSGSTRSRKSSSAAKTCHFQHKPEGGIRDALPGSGVGLRAIVGRVSADRSMCTVVFRLNL